MILRNNNNDDDDKNNNNNNFPDTSITHNWYIFVMEAKCATETRYLPAFRCSLAFWINEDVKLHLQAHSPRRHMAGVEV